MAVTGTQQLAPGISTTNMRPELDLGAEAMRRRTLLRFVDKHRDSLGLTEEQWIEVQNLPKHDDKRPDLVTWINTHIQMGKLPPLRRPQANDSEVDGLKSQVADLQRTVETLISQQGGVPKDPMQVPHVKPDEMEPWQDTKIPPSELTWGDLRKRAKNLYGKQTHGVSREGIEEMCLKAEAGGDMAEKEFHNA